MLVQKEILLPAFPRGCHLITDIIEKHIGSDFNEGLLHIFLQHTSAGVCINENADPTVRLDFNNFFDKLVPENLNIYKHIYEGADDITAHLKTAIIGQSVTIPISGNKLNLGCWQGVYLCEFRNNGGKRKIILTMFC